MSTFFFVFHETLFVYVYVRFRIWFNDDFVFLKYLHSDNGTDIVRGGHLGDDNLGILIPRELYNILTFCRYRSMYDTTFNLRRNFALPSW